MKKGGQRWKKEMAGEQGEEDGQKEVEIVEIAERRGKAIMLLSPMYKSRSWYY